MYRYIGRMMSEEHAQPCTIEFDRKLDIKAGCINEDVRLLARTFIENWLYKEDVQKILFVQI